MNLWQKAVVGAGVLLALLALLFPPYHWRGVNGAATGFHFVFRPGSYTGDVDNSRLFLEVLVIAGCSWAAASALRRAPSTGSELDAMADAARERIRQWQAERDRLSNQQE